MTIPFEAKSVEVDLEQVAAESEQDRRDRACGRRDRPGPVRGGAAVLSVGESIAIVQRARVIAATDHATLVRAQRELAEA